MPKLIRPVVLMALAGALAAISGGCTGGEKVASVSGTVTFKGKPLPGGTIVFLSEDKTKQEMAPIKSDGTYSASSVPWGKVLIGV
jgi:hypothetical protein